MPVAVALAIGLAASFGPSLGDRAWAQVPPGPAGISTPAPTFNPAANPEPSAFPSVLLSPTPGPSRRHHGAPASSSSASPAPTATPTSPAFATLDGTWELQLQYTDRTEYSYLVIAQQASGTVTGFWRVNGKSLPFEGTYDGRLIRVLVKEPIGNVTMSGYVEGATDMVGIVDLGNGATSPTAFTAEHRALAKGSVFKKGI